MTHAFNFPCLRCGLLWSLAASVCFLDIASAAEPEWKAGVAQTKITPEKPVYMSGYASRNKPHEGVEHDLFAKALALVDNQGHRAVLVTVDLCLFQPAVIEPVCERIKEKTGLERGQIVFNASHTHTGPELLTKLPDDKQDDPAAKNTLEYTKTLQDRLVDVAVQAVEHAEPAKLSWGTGVATFVMNRREFTEQGVKLGVNPRGLVDRSVPVLRIDTPDGKPRAVWFGCACHNTTLGGDLYQICGDYAGFAQIYVQERYPGVQAMFMQDCGGDANPYPRGQMEIARLHGKMLGEEVCRVLETKLEEIHGPLTVKYKVLQVPLQATPPRDVLTQMAAKRSGWEPSIAKQMLAQLDRGEAAPSHFAYPISAWQFGDDLTWVGLSGEVVVEYQRRLEQSLGPRKLWVAGYCHDIFGYVPSARILREGGYETRGLFGGDGGFFAPEIEDTVVEGATALAIEAGRKAPER